MNIDIIRAWKESSYRSSLSEEELALLPENPVGSFDLTDKELKAVCGAGAQPQTGQGKCENTSQGGLCQSVGSGSQCSSQQGICQSVQCPSQGGTCPSAGSRHCNITLGGHNVC